MAMWASNAEDEAASIAITCLHVFIFEAEDCPAQTSFQMIEGMAAQGESKFWQTNCHCAQSSAVRTGPASAIMAAMSMDVTFLPRSSRMITLSWHHHSLRPSKSPLNTYTTSARLT